MDWSHLRLLDLGINYPQHYFEEFGKSLPSLKSLTIVIRSGDSHSFPSGAQEPTTCNNVLPIHRFLITIPALRELSITDFNSNFADIFEMIETKCQKLRKISYHASLSRRRAHSSERLERALAELAKLLELRELTLDFPLVNGE